MRSAFAFAFVIIAGALGAQPNTPAPPRSPQARNLPPIVHRVEATMELARLIDSVTVPVARIMLQCHDGGPAPDDADSLIAFARGPLIREHLVHPPTLDTLHLAHRALRRKCPDSKLLASDPLAPPGTAVQESAAAVGRTLSGLAPQTAIIHGLTTFLLDRARDEVVLSFLEQLRKSSNGDKIASLMPSSWRLLGDLQTISFGSIVPALRAALARDMDSLPVRVIQFLPAKSQQREVLELGVRVALALRDGAPPASALSELASFDVTTLQNVELQRAILRAGLLAREYRVNADLIHRIAQDTAGRRHFLAFFVADEMVAKRVPDAAEGVEFINRRSTEVLAFIDRIRTLQASVDTLQQRVAAAKVTSVEAHAVILRHTAQLVRSGRYLLSESDFARVAPADALLGYVTTAADLLALVATRDYQQVMVAVLDLVHRLELELVVADADKLPATARRFLAFASAIASAQTSDEVNAALRASAVPVGSYRAKRLAPAGGRPVSVTINGYVGLGGGEESVRTDARNVLSRYMAPAVPFGLEVSRAFNCLSLGAFVPLIDLGTIASTRFSESEVEQEPEVGFAQVFAPGIFGVVGITASYPLTVGAGFQQVPRLRETADGLRTATRRFSFFVAVDVPVFRF